MGFPELHPYRPAEAIQTWCSSGNCSIARFKTNQVFRYPSLYSKPENSKKKKIMLVLDIVEQTQMTMLGQAKSVEDLWASPLHKTLKAVLETLLTEDCQIFITHMLKCDQHASFPERHRKYIYTSSKDVNMKTANRQFYEEEKPHFHFCANHLKQEIADYAPDILVTFGHRVTSYFIEDAGDIYTSRGLTRTIDFEGRKVMIVSTLGLREIAMHCHLASQWKVDIGRALWFADEFHPEEFDKIPIEFYEVRTIADYQRLFEYLRDSGVPFAWDTETSSLKKIENRCLMLTLTFDGKSAYIIPVDAQQFLPGHPQAEFIQLTKKLLSLPSAKALLNLKFDLQAFSSHTYEEDFFWLPENCEDVANYAYTFEENFGDAEWKEEKQPGLTGHDFHWLSLAGQVTNMLGIWDKQWLAEKADRKDMVKAIQQKGWSAIACYAGKDAIYTYRLWYMYHRLMYIAQKEEFFRVAKKLLSVDAYVLTQIERGGYPVDPLAINAMMDAKSVGSIAWEVKQAEEEFRKLPSVQKYSMELAKKKNAGKPQRTMAFKTVAVDLTANFNVNSPTQLSGFFFDFMKIKPLSDARSTDKHFIAHYATQYKEVGLLKTCRERAKVLGTYLPGFKDNAIQYSDGRVRASFQLTTVTGRTSCAEPNLQQIPRTEEGETVNEIKGLVKKVVRARPGFCLVMADYATAEIRMLAMVSKDPDLAAVFRKVDAYRAEFIQNPSVELYQKLKTEADFHKQNASNMMKIPLLEVTKSQRSAAKSLSFMIVYSYFPAPNLAGTLNISMKEAEKLIKAYLGTYNGVNNWFQEIEKLGKAKGHIWSIVGQRRCLYGMFGNRDAHKHALNVNRNSPVQGPASHWTLIAAYDYMQQLAAAKSLTRVISVVHDAIYLEMPITDVEEWVPKLLRTMELPPSIYEFFDKEYVDFVPQAADCELGLVLYDMCGWDDTPEHLTRIRSWLENNAPAEEMPETFYKAKKEV